MSHDYPVQLLMGWVNRLVVLEPVALRQGEYVHCAAQQFCLIFAPDLNAAPDRGRIHKRLFFNVKMRFPRRALRPLCAIGTLLCAERESKTARPIVALKRLASDSLRANQPTAAAAVGST
jgi:hypothetical protein